MATYFVRNDGDDAADGLSDGNAWKTVAKVNASTFAPGDTIKFNQGDTWAEELIPPDSGTAANRITFTSYGTGDMPIIGGATVNNALDIGNLAYLDFSSIDFLGTIGDNAGAHVAVIRQGNNYRFTSVYFRGGQAGTQGQCVRISNNAEVTDVDFDTCLFESGWDGGVVITHGNGGQRIYFHSPTFDDKVGALDNDLLAIGGPGTTDDIQVNDPTFLRTVAGGNFSLDITSGTNVVIRRGDFDDDDFHIANITGTVLKTSVLFEDCNHECDTTAWGRVRDDAVVIFRRGNFHDQTEDRTTTSGGLFIEGWRTTTPGGPEGTDVTCEACAFYVENGAPTKSVIQVDNNSNLTLKGCTVIMRNGAGLGEQIIRLSNTDNRAITGSVKIYNTIIDGANVPLIEETDPNADYTFDLQHNLYYRADQTTGWFVLQDEGVLGEADIGATAPMDDEDSTSGDPDFTDEDDSSSDYLLLNTTPASPGLGIGDPAFSPATDLVGNPYEPTTPNVGARETPEGSPALRPSIAPHFVDIIRAI